jgi:hypothetical protein
MFRKEYPRNCTTFCTKFEGAYTNSSNPIVTGCGITFGCGNWRDKFDAGIFYISVESKGFSNTYYPLGYGVRVSYYCK